MLFDPKHEDRLDRLMEQLRLAPALTADLISNVVAGACTRLPVLHRAGKAARIDQLIEAGAWSDAALALIELELPAWKLRRLIMRTVNGSAPSPSGRICPWRSMTLQTRGTKYCLSQS
jgi:hypothetical protein